MSEPAAAEIGGEGLSESHVLTLAEQYHAAGRLGAAEELCRRVLAGRPEQARALHLLGIVLHQRGDSAAGIELLRRAIAAGGDIALYYSNLGEIYRLSGQLDEAVSAGRRAVELRPSAPEALNNLGIANFDRGDHEQAAVCYRQAIRLRPHFAEAHNNLAHVYLAGGKTAEALALYQRAILLKPDYVDAHSNLAMTLLLTGDFANGWLEFEWRRRRGGLHAEPYAAPLWRGERFPGRTLLVHAEEGHGDAIHFMRYLPAVAEQGGAVLLAVHPPLLRLARSLAGPSQVIALNAAPPAYDIQCPLMSLPLLFGTTLDIVPATVPYLGTDSAVSQRWRRRLSGIPGLRVGVVWSGAPGYMHNRQRAIPADQLTPLLALEGISWFSLQVGKPTAELAQLPSERIVDLSAELTDYAETAGVLENLDLVISTDTSVPHLAGALARPVWVMLAFMPDWRWLLDRETSPWYPTMRLFRQAEAGDWEPVVARVAAELRAIIAGDRDRLMRGVAR